MIFFRIIAAWTEVELRALVISLSVDPGRNSPLLAAPPRTRTGADWRIRFLSEKAVCRGLRLFNSHACHLGPPARETS
jgi:hypothetical protein